MNLLIRKIAPALTIVTLAWLLVNRVPTILEFIVYTKSVLAYPYVWAMTENENMLAIFGLMSGHNVYALKETDTFYYFVYPPFFHAIAALASKLFGFTIFIPRLISLVSLVAIFVCLFLFFKAKLTKVENLTLTLLVSSFTLAISLYAKYYILARADMLALALAFGSLLMVWKIVYQNEQTRLNYLLASLLAIAAIFTKQSILFPFILIALCSLVTDNRMSWLRFIIYLGCGTIATFLLLQLITAGEFWQSMTMASEIYGKYLNSFDHLWKLQAAFIKHFWPLLLGLPLLIIHWQISKTAKIPFTLLLSIAIYINFLISGGNQGAEHNTLIPLVFGLALAAKELATFGKWRSLGLSLFLILSIIQVLNFRSLVSNPYLMPTLADIEAQTALVKLLSSSSATILGDRVDYATLLAHKNSPLEASTHNVALAWAKTKPYAKTVESKLLTLLKERQIDTALLTITNFGKTDLFNYIESNMVLSDTLKINYIDAPQLPHRIYRHTP